MIGYVEVPSASGEAHVWDVIADAGGLAVVLAVAVAVLWRSLSRVIERVLGEQSTATAKLQEQQTQSIDRLAGAVHQVELAVTRSDERNVAALSAIRQSLDRHETRLDRLDGVLVDHDRRLIVLEASESGAHRRRAGGD